MNADAGDVVAGCTVMVVDDEPENLNVLDAALSHTGYQMLFFTRGELALEAARMEPPDIVLLDVRMPGVGGHELCSRFKADANLRDIPILFISALSSAEDIAQGFACGAVDYIAKPIRAAEVIARVKTHLALNHAYAKLDEQHRRLLDLERQRDAYVHMLVHDLRSPLMALRGHLQLIGASGISSLSARDRANLDDAVHCTRMLGRMVSTVVDLSRLEAGAMPLNRQNAEVGMLFQAARDLVLDPSVPRRVAERIPAECPKPFCDVDLSVRIIGNFLDNAVKYASGDTEIVLGASADGEGVRLWVQDSGQGIDAAYLETIFAKYGVAGGVTNSSAPSSGIGLAFCKLATELQDGRIGVSSRPGFGSTFWIVLPVARADSGGA